MARPEIKHGLAVSHVAAEAEPIDPAWLRRVLPPALEPSGGAAAARRGVASRVLRPASVLVPIVMTERPRILLTKRAVGLRHHAGQVSFPGGRSDPTDPDAEHTALREAWEEIRLDPASCDVVGRLPAEPTSSDFEVTPVVAFVRPDAVWQAAPAEVDQILFLPVANLLDPEAVRQERALYRGSWHHYWVWHHPEHVIWGATAGILMTLAERLGRIISS